MPVTQQGGRILWQGQPTPCCLCLLSCQPTQCGANSEGSTDTVGGVLRRYGSVARVGKKRAEWIQNMAGIEREQACLAKTGKLTDVGRMEKDFR